MGNYHRNKIKTCCYCGIKLDSSNFSREHVQPSSKGGSNKKHNKLPCCIPCNRQKGCMTLDQYVDWLYRNKPENWQRKVQGCEMTMYKTILNR